LAAVYLGQAVSVCRFDEFVSAVPVDGIWACASLLHVAAAELPLVLAHLVQPLRVGGHVYCSFKYGDGMVSRAGRTFTQLDESGLAQLLAGLPLEAVTVWQTGDLRAGRADERWLNAIVRKTSA
jgi:hypothetical protein